MVTVAQNHRTMGTQGILGKMMEGILPTTAMNRRMTLMTVTQAVAMEVSHPTGATRDLRQRNPR